VARRRTELDRVAAEVRGKQPAADIDVQTIDLVEPSPAQEIFGRFPSVDLLLNNARFGTTGAFLAQDWATYRRMIDRPVRALRQLTWLYGGAMRAHGSGTIMTIGAIAGFGPTPNFAMFGATRALLNLSEALDFELRLFGIRVLAYCPGGIDTPF